MNSDDDGIKKTVWIACTLEIWAQQVYGNANRVVITTVNESTEEVRNNLWDTIVETIGSGGDPIKTIPLTRVVPEDVDFMWQKDDLKNVLQTPLEVKDDPSEAEEIVFKKITEPYNCLFVPKRQEPERHYENIFQFLRTLSL